MTDDLYGARLLDHVRARMKTYVAFPSEHAVVAAVLWTAATHAIGAWEHATRLAVHSPMKRCGKSRLLEIIEALVHKPVATTNISVPALFRTIEAGGDSPSTLILDEADRLFGTAKKDEENSDLIALLNNGFRQGRPTIRCVGPMLTPTPFANFAMAAIAGIGRLPDTIEDRAVNITMRRRLPGQQVAKFRLRTDLPEMHELRDQLADWAEQNLRKLEQPVRDLPAELEDRAQDAWEPLLAIADVAGGDWPAAARAAAVALADDAADNDGAQSLDLRLLTDIRAIFEAASGGFLGTGSLLTKLRAIEDAPWSDFDLNPRKLALRLTKFEVAPRHNTTKTERGYHLEDFRDVFPRYLPSDPSASVHIPPEQGKLPDASKSPDGSTRPAEIKRPDEFAGQSTYGREWTGWTDTPLAEGVDTAGIPSPAAVLKGTDEPADVATRCPGCSATVSGPPGTLARCVACGAAARLEHRTS